MNNYEFIKGFQEIKLSRICKEKNINLSNLVNGSTTEENYTIVKNEIIKELLNLFTSYKTDSLAYLSIYDEVIKKLVEENKMLRRLVK